jgi:clan AA aspartic protease (TIGR02281 family)
VSTYANGDKYVGEYKDGVISKGNFMYASGEQVAFDQEVVEMEESGGGTYVVPVLVNNTITLPFQVDSGAAEVVISGDVVETLKLAGALSEADFRKKKTAVLADGSSHDVIAFTIRSLKVGSKMVENVDGIVAPGKGSLLLGQSFLRKFKSVLFDNKQQTLLLSEQR